MTRDNRTSHPLKAVLVGCGGISGTWLEAAAHVAGLEIVGLVDLHRHAAQKRAAEFGLSDAVVDDDLEQVLLRLRPDIVFDCTVPEAHIHVTTAALRYGCHVLGEKPMADTMANAQAMVRAARAAGKQYAVIQNRRYQAGIRRLKRLLESGAIGPITAVYSDFFIGAHFGGFRERMDHVLLLDMAIHTFDAARFITGADPLSVYCHEWNPSGSWYAHGAAAVAQFEMSGGSVYSYRGSWCAEGLHTSWNSAWRVVGEGGSVLWDGEQGFRAQKIVGNSGFHRDTADLDVPRYDDQRKLNGHTGLIREFVDCVRRGTTPETAAWDNIKSLAMVFGAVNSAERGTRVPIGVTS
jgi:predicted dehydrogenase